MLSALFSLGGKMKYDTTGMDVAYVQSLYPNESPEVIIKAIAVMLIVPLKLYGLAVVSLGFTAVLADGGYIKTAVFG